MRKLTIDEVTHASGGNAQDTVTGSFNGSGSSSSDDGSAFASGMDALVQGNPAAGIGFILNVLNQNAPEVDLSNAMGDFKKP